MKNKCLFFMILICCFTCLLGVGYAQISGVDLSVSGNALALKQSGVVISSIKYQSDVGADITNSKIITYYQTLLSTKTILGDELSSSLTYQIKFKNMTSAVTYYDGITYDNSFYDNDDIVIVLDGLNVGDSINPGEEISATVTFKYKDGLTAINNNELNSYVKFKFVDTVGAHTITYDSSIPASLYGYPTSVADHGSVSFYLQGEKPTKIYVNNKLWLGYNMNTGRLVLDDITEDITIRADYTPVSVAIFDSKNTLYNKMISLAGGAANIRAIKYSDSTDGVTTTEVQDSSSTEKIYMWYDNGTIYWNSNNINPKLIGGYGQLFNGFSNLVDISGLESWDTSEVTALWETFKGCSSLVDAEPLKYWDVSSVTNMLGMFNGCTSLSSIKGFDNWDVSNVTNMNSLFVSNRTLSDISPLSTWNVSNVRGFSGIFQACSSLSDISPLAYWNTSSATEMIQMFQATLVSDLSPISNFNVSNVTDMRQMFFQCRQVTSLGALSNWDTKSLTSLNQTFAQMSKLTSTDGLDNWDVSKVTNFNSLFDGCSNLTTLNGLRNWNVENGRSYTAAFYGLSKLTADGASKINDWNLSNTATFTGMFRNTSNRPTFTFIVDGATVQGAYDSNGTLYIPS